MNLPNISENDSQPRHLGDLIVDYLELLGIEYVFGVPGGHISALLEALERSKRRGGTRCILSRHETGAAFMADGYARETGKIGVCFATTGPGATNLITGVASAYAEHIPLLVITAQTPVRTFGLDAVQESSPTVLNVTAMFDTCTRYNTIVTHPNQLEHHLTAALTATLHSPQGPAHLNIPVDIFRSPAPQKISYPNLKQRLAQPLSYVDLAALDELCSILYTTLMQGKKVVLLLDQDCRGASKEIMAFAELIGASFITTPSGKSWGEPYHPLYKGLFAFATHTTAREALGDESVDLILAVGSILNIWATSNWDDSVLNEKLVHIHHVNTYFRRSPMARLHVYGNIKTVFEQLIKRLKTGLDDGVINLEGTAKEPQDKKPKDEQDGFVPPQLEIRNPESYHSDAVPIKPQRLFYELMRRFPPETRFLTDNCNAMAWAYHYFFRSPSEYFRTAAHFASMTWGIGASIGTALAVPNTPVVCLTGDGCYLMAGQEITVAVGEKLPVIFIILNDACYGMVRQRHGQIGKAPIDVSIPPVDFSLMAKAVGANGYIISGPEDLEKLDFEAICSYPGPTVLDVRIDPDELSPLGVI